MQTTPFSQLLNNYPDSSGPTAQDGEPDYVEFFWMYECSEPFDQAVEISKVLVHPEIVEDLNRLGYNTNYIKTAEGKFFARKYETVGTEPSPMPWVMVSSKPPYIRR